MYHFCCLLVNGGGDLDVAVETPALAPKVAYDVVLDAVCVDSPTDSDESVVDLLAAAIVGSDDTAGVVSEDVVAGGDNDVDELLSETSKVVCGTAGLAVGGNVGDAISLVVDASAIVVIRNFIVMIINFRLLI